MKILLFTMVFIGFTANMYACNNTNVDKKQEYKI